VTDLITSSEYHHPSKAVRVSALRPNDRPSPTSHSLRASVSPASLSRLKPAKARMRWTAAPSSRPPWPLQGKSSVMWRSRSSTV
jgi:hypothetical protein